MFQNSVNKSSQEKPGHDGGCDASVSESYARHSRAARELAESELDSDRVLGALVESVLN